MSNPLDLFIETLRSAEPHPEAVARAVARVHTSPRRRLVPLAFGVAGLSAFALWPHGSGGLAWAQVVDQELPARYRETQTVIAGGRSRILMEAWVDRPSDSRRSLDRLFRDWIEDGKSVATNPLNREFEFVESPRGFYSRQNEFATYTRKPKSRSGYDPRATSNVRRRTGLQRLLDDKRVRQVKVERDVATRVGRADRYVLDRPAGSKSERIRRFVVYVQPGTKRILGSDERETSGDLWQQTFEYPAGFPRGTFDIPLRNCCPAHDLDALNAVVETRLRRPIATLRAGGRTALLRLVAQADDKQLWVLWSGARPNGGSNESGCPACQTEPRTAR